MKRGKVKKKKKRIKLILMGEGNDPTLFIKCLFLSLFSVSIIDQYIFSLHVNYYMGVIEDI